MKISSTYTGVKANIDLKAKCGFIITEARK